jgi:ABC-type polysaccharide/polyol phosphate export permease
VTRGDRASAAFVWEYARSQLRLKYRYTALGAAWNLLDPLLYLAVLSLVFSYVNAMRPADYALFLFSGLLPWRYFEKVVSNCTDAIVQGDWLLKKLPASPFVLPVSRWVVASIEFGWSFLAVTLVLLVLHARWTVHALVLPLSVLPWAVAALGAGLLASVAYTFFRDVRPVVQLLLMLAFFTAPILFNPALFPDGSLQARLLVWHPLTYLTALFQKPVYAGRWPDPLDWSVSWLTAVGALGAGVISVQRTRARLYFYL